MIKIDFISLFHEFYSCKDPAQGCLKALRPPTQPALTH